MELRDRDAFEHLELINVAAEAAADEPWFNETLTTVNEAVVLMVEAAGVAPTGD